LEFNDFRWRILQGTLMTSHKLGTGLFYDFVSVLLV